ncbi:MAG: CHASE2 domain-containing protein [Verrucomicrobia bacterium]|nr:CHASE2 domain-containing protein [Verrucomicrobiota bacterium]
MAASSLKTGFWQQQTLYLSLVCGLCVLVAMALGRLDFLIGLELRTLDKRFQWRPTAAILPSIVVIGIDDGDQLQFGKWPWPRNLHGQMLAAFTNATIQPGAIAYDVIFSSAKEDDEAKRKENAEFGGVLQNLGNVCLAGQVRRSPLSSGADYSWLTSLVIPAGETVANFKPEHDLLVPDSALRQDTHFGVLNVDQDDDGVIRRIPILVREGRHWVPSLALRTAMLCHDVHLNEVTIVPGKEVRLQKSDGWKMRFPIDQDQQLYINYRGTLDEFASIPFRGVMDWLNPEINQNPEVKKLGDVLKQAHQGVVVVGMIATGDSSNAGIIPLYENSPMVAVHVNAINNLLLGDFLRRLPWWGVALITACISAMGTWATHRFSAIKSAVIVVGALILFYTVTWLLFWLASIWTPWIVPPLGLVLAYAAGTVLRFTAAEKHTEKLTGAFQSYVSADLVKKKLRGATSGQAVTGDNPALTAVLPELQLAVDSSPLIGLGKYNLLCKLGQGGMGAVFLGRDKANKRFCAVKVLNPQFSEDRDATERFLREARTMSGLAHPNLVALYECDQVEGQYFIAMEFIEGMSVGDMLKDRTPIPLPLALHWLKQAAAGLEYIHNKTMIHRDIKPDNLMVDDSGNLKITDLGLAKNRADSDQAMTVTGTVMGSPHYMSPEQVRESKNVDHRADIYSLGVTFYQMVTGHVPYDNRDSAAAVCMAHINEPMPSVELPQPELTQALDILIQRITAKEKEQRFQSAGEIIAAIDPWIQLYAVDESSQQFFARLGFEQRKATFVMQKFGIDPGTMDSDIGGSIAATDVLPQAKGSTLLTSAPIVSSSSYRKWLIFGIAFLLLVIGGTYLFLRSQSSPEKRDAQPAQADPEESPPKAPESGAKSSPPARQPEVRATPPVEGQNTNAPPPESASTTNQPPAAATTAKTAVLIVNTDPVGAKVILLGTTNTSPARIEQAIAGKHRLRIVLEGYQEIEQEVEIKEGENNLPPFSLKKVETPPSKEPPAPTPAPAPVP